MPFPLPDNVSVLLRADATAAMAAASIIANAHGDMLRWVAATIGEAPRPDPKPVRSKSKLNGSRGHRKAKPARRARGLDGYLSRRRAQRDRDDEALLEAMRTAPQAAIKDWSDAIGKSKSSTVSALKRLRDADQVKNAGGRWGLVEQDAPREPAPRWVDKVRGTDRPREHHLT
jgi:hypothetical protein